VDRSGGGRGTWCAPGHRLEIEQRFQAFSAALSAKGSAVPLVFDGRIEGRTLRSPGAPSFELELEGDALRARRGGAAPGWPTEARFRRAEGSNC
jgi:hypothetical protein